MNQLFAEKTIVALKTLLSEQPNASPLIWIHDYHLMLAANWVRQVSINILKLKNKIL